MHQHDQRVHCAVHQKHKSLFAQLIAHSHVLLELFMKYSARSHRLIEQIRDVVARIGVLVVNLRLNAEIHADIHKLSFRTSPIPTLFAICWRTASLGWGLQMSLSAVGMSGVETRQMGYWKSRDWALQRGSPCG